MPLNVYPGDRVLRNHGDSIRISWESLRRRCARKRDESRLDNKFTATQLAEPTDASFLPRSRAHLGTSLALPHRQRGRTSTNPVPRQNSARRSRSCCTTPSRRPERQTAGHLKPASAYGRLDSIDAAVARYTRDSIRRRLRHRERMQIPHAKLLSWAEECPSSAVLSFMSSN